MKGLSFALFGVCFIAALIQPTESVGESAILNFLEELRVRMCHPIELFGFKIPPTDPFQISHTEFEMDNKYIVDFQGSFTNLRLTGLSDFVVDNLRISILPLQRSIMKITLPFTQLKTMYSAFGSIAQVVNLAGRDDGDVYIDSFSVEISWNMKTGLTLGIRNLNIAITIKQFHIDFGHLIEEVRINDFFHAIINELGLELLGDVWEDVGDNVIKKAEDTINNVLNGLTIGDIVGIVTGGGGGEEPPFGGAPGDCKSFLRIANNTTTLN